MYSQNDEEKHILNKFATKTNGTFLDVGAFDGRWASNTLALAEKGWNGVCIEGSPFSFSKLFMEHLSRTNVLLLNAIVSHDLEIQESDRIVKFWESPNSAASTINKENYEKWKDRIQSCGHGNFKEMFVPKVSFREVLKWTKLFYPSIDFVSIDVEGGSTDLALQFNPDDFKTTMMCIEHDGRYTELVTHFARWGFYPVSNNAENIILARNLS
jgi:FkbM family methyltransferase